MNIKERSATSFETAGKTKQESGAKRNAPMLISDGIVTIIADVGSIHAYNGKLRDRITLENLAKSGSNNTRIFVYSDEKPRYLALMSGELPIAVERFDSISLEDSSHALAGKAHKPGYVARFTMPKLVQHSFNELWDGSMVVEFDDKRMVELSIKRESSGSLGRRGKPENIRNHLDTATVRTGLEGDPILYIEGWTLSTATLNPVTVELFLDGVRVQSTVPNKMRPDVLESLSISKPITPGFVIHHRITGARPKVVALQLRTEDDAEALAFSFDKIPGAKAFLASEETFFEEEISDAPLAVIQGGLRKYFTSKDKSDDGSLSIIIPTRLSTDNIFPLVQALRKSNPGDEIIIVGHEVNPEAQKQLRTISDQYVNVKGKFNWSKFNNHAASKASKQYLLFLNDDVYPISPNWRSQLLSTLNASVSMGAVGARLVGKDLRFQHDGIELYGKFTHHINLGQTKDSVQHGQVIGPLDGVTGAFLATPRLLFNEIGRFDESLDIIGNDFEYCIRLGTKGYFSGIPKDLFFFHAEGSSRSNIKDNEISEILDERLPAAGRLRIFDHGRSLDRDGEPVVIQTRKKVEISRVLLIKIDHIGDFYGALGAIRALVASYPKAEFTLVCAPEVEESAKRMSLFAEVLPYRVFNKISEKGKEPTKEIPRMLLGKIFDVAIDLRKHSDARALLYKVKATHKFAFQGHSPILSKEVIHFHGFHEAKEVHYAPSISNELQAFANFIVRHLATLPTKISLEDLRNSRGVSPTKYECRIAVFPLSGNSSRAYPISLYLQFAILHKSLNPNAKICIVIPADQVGQVIDIDRSEMLKRNGIDLITPTALTQVEEIIGESDLVVTNNTGPMWIASELGRPCIAIFSGVVSPAHWLPEHVYQIVRNVGCSPCHIAQAGQCHRNMFCLNSIDPSYISVLADYIALQPHRPTA